MNFILLNLATVKLQILLIPIYQTTAGIIQIFDSITLDLPAVNVQILLIPLFQTQSCRFSKNS